MTDDRELTGDEAQRALSEAQRALSEAVRRIRATVPDTVLEGPAQERLWQAFEAGHHAWPTPDAPTRRALFERWLSSSPASVATGAGADVTADTSDGYHTFRELYEYRKAYNALLFNQWAALGLYDVHKSWLHSDGEPCFGGGWFVVVAQMPTGQISNHYKADEWSLFAVPERERGAEWDGHTPQVALERLLSQAAALAPLPDAAPSPTYAPDHRCPEIGADTLHGAFVAGAKWWEWTSTGGTMWASDRDTAWAEAEKRYGPLPLPHSASPPATKGE